ncbi:NAD(P)-dependent oxidoreductase [Candidatus Amarobacter glycogenicus]|uniref:NAD-dependent epimerase/dehydratase family protein n=1 Tax=Candidatus Amarobacter glycogenicus TaxID=3140699 RepID=UPI002A14CDFF|nr:NAD(P)-dependent oxidoreductase [Dehalococcoidia bacterium]MBK9611323.1 NAD(P)-dependent oxidoreductase [Dehalococcoidia bacterium]
MRILVTGGAGYIGSVLVPKLLERGHEVRVVDRMFWGLPHYAHLPGVELVNADVRRLPEGVFEGIDAVDHLAGFSNDPTAEFSPEANWQMNAVATDSIAELCRAAGVKRLVFGSSCSLYDGAAGSEELLDEAAAIAPLGAYATSKHYSEEALLRRSSSDFEPVILRQATVFGLSARMRLDLVVNAFVKDALVRQRLILHGGGRMWRPLIAVNDLAAAHAACLEAPSELVAGETFNAVGSNYQVRELAEVVANALIKLGKPVALEDGPLPKIVRNYRCSGEKLRKRLDLKLETTPAIAVNELVAQYGKTPIEQLGHPRYYNIAWMELLEQVRPAYQAMQNIFEPIEE